MSNKTIEERYQKILKELRNIPQNKKCMNCKATFPQYIVIDFSIWVCTNCSGIHREFSHKVKSPTMSKFKEDEIKKLKEGGNEIAMSIWRAKWNPRDFPEPEVGDISRIRDFIRLTFIDKKWYRSSNSNEEIKKNVESSTSEPKIKQQNKISTVENSLISFDDIPNEPISSSSEISNLFKNIPPAVPNTTTNLFSNNFQATPFVNSSSTNPFSQLNVNSSLPNQSSLINTSQPNFFQQNSTPPLQQISNTNPFSQLTTNSSLQNPLINSSQLNFFQQQKSSPPLQQISNNTNPFKIQAQEAQNFLEPSKNNFQNFHDSNLQTFTKNVDPLDIFSSFNQTSLNQGLSSSITPLQPPPPRIALIKPPNISNENIETKKVNEREDNNNNNNSIMRCPICNRKFSSKASNEEINIHIDKCLNHDTSPSTSSDNWQKFFDLSKMDWYFGNIDRKEAERILRSCTDDSFLVRTSSVKNSYALSLYNHKKQIVTHSLIESRPGGYAFQGELKVYPTLIELVNSNPECFGLKPPPKTSF